MTNIFPLHPQSGDRSATQSHEDDSLARLLVDLSPERQARVLDLVMRLGIERDDPLFLIAMATNQLMVLVQDAPEDWSALFAAFLERLDAWSARNLSILENIATERAATEQLSEHCAVLAQNTGELQAVLKDLITTLETTPVETPGWEASLKTVQRELTMVITSTRGAATMTRPIAARATPSAKLAGDNTTRRSVLTPVFKIAVLTFLGLNIGMGLWQMTVQRRQYSQLNQRLEWLLQKHNRRDCKDGTLPPDNPLCTSQ